MMLLEKLNKQKVIQTKYNWKEDFDELPMLFDEKPVAEGLLVDTRRWYETSISVYKAGDKFIGVRHITNIFSELDDYESCHHTLQFYLMEPVQITTYQLTNKTN